MNFQAMREFCRLIQAREPRKICILPHQPPPLLSSNRSVLQPPLPLVLSNGSTFPPSSFGPVSTPRGLGNLPLPSFNYASTQGEEGTLSTRLGPFRHQGNPSSSFVWPRFDTRRRGFSPLVWPHYTRKTGNPGLPPIWPRFDTRRRGESSFPLSATFRHLKDVYPSSLVWPHFDIRATPCPSPFGRVSTPGRVSLILTPRGRATTPVPSFGPISTRRRDNRPRLTHLN